MPIREYKPVTPGRRQGSVSDFSDCTAPKKNKPEKYEQAGRLINEGL